MIRRTIITATAATCLAASAYAGSHTMDGMDIVDTAAGADNLTTLVSAIEAAGLAETLKGEGPFTVFAPTDEAFEALPEGTLDELLLPENSEQLTSILTYHVVPGAVMSGDLTDGMMPETVEGSTLEIATEGGVTVNGATVETPDIEASNGVVHVIDTVLMPEGM